MIKFGGTYIVSLLQAICKFNTSFNAFQTLQALIYFDYTVRL